ncbi:hypothetical protein [Bacillus cereus]|nr:hypothetical protein [Bacillus cereus]
MVKNMYKVLGITALMGQLMIAPSISHADTDQTSDRIQCNADEKQENVIYYADGTCKPFNENGHRLVRFG